MRDRSKEFFSTAEVLRAQATVGSLPPAARLAPRSPLYRSSHALASLVKESAGRVERLSRLAARRGLFDDPAAEVNALTAALKGDLQGLDVALRAFLAEAVRQAGGGGGGGGASSGGAPPSDTSPRAFWNGVAELLRARTLDVTRGFHAALRARGDSMRAAAAQRATYARSNWAPSPSALGSPLFADAPAPPPQGGQPPPPPPPWGAPHLSIAAPASSPGAPAAAAASLRRRGGAAPLPGGGSSSLSAAAAQGDSGTGGLAGARGPSAAARPPSGAYSYSAQQVAAYHSSRARVDEMRGVEATLSELGHMFTRLAGLVAEQGETVERIDADVEAALTNVNEAQGELQSMYESASKNRALVLKVFAVLVGIVLLFAAVR